MTIKRFTAYRRNLSALGHHNQFQSNPDDRPQFECVVFTDGTVAQRWLTQAGSTCIWPDIESCLRVHGHPEYGTVIEFHDGPPHPFWIAMCAAHFKKTLDEQPMGYS